MIGRRINDFDNFMTAASPRQIPLSTIHTNYHTNDPTRHQYPSISSLAHLIVSTIHANLWSHLVDHLIESIIEDKQGWRKIRRGRCWRGMVIMLRVRGCLVVPIRTIPIKKHNTTSISKIKICTIVEYVPPKQPVKVSLSTKSPKTLITTLSPPPPPVKPFLITPNTQITNDTTN